MSERPSWIDEVRRPPERVPRAADRPAPLLFDETNRPITSAEGWSRRRGQLESRWREFLGAINAPRAVGPVKVVETDRRGGVVRRLIRYEAEPGLPVEAYWLTPLGGEADAKRPGVVVFHSTTDASIRQPAGLDGPEDKFIGLHLARRGFEVLCPRCFLWQYSEGGKIGDAVDWLRRRHPGVRGMAKMAYDAVRAVDHLLSFPGVDPPRVGSIGHSLGAKEVFYLAAFDRRVRATVSSEGGIGLRASNWDAPWYHGDEVRRPGFPLDHGQILSLIAPRAFLLIGGNSADGDASWPYVEAALPVWSLLGRPDGVGLFVHPGGHAFPAVAQTRADEWLSWFLRA